MPDTWEAKHQCIEGIHCGGGHEGVGCGEVIQWLNQLYRCGDCDTPFHKHCMIKHFNVPGGKGELFEKIAHFPSPSVVTLPHAAVSGNTP